MSATPTPSPLRRMEDPTDWHVQSTRSKRAAADRASMPPPSRVTNKRILDEDTYVEGLDTIIGRDYFPDLPKLKAQAEWLSALQTRNPRVIAEVREKIMSEQRKFGLTPTPRATPRGETPMGTPRSDWAGTPSRTPSDVRTKNDEDQRPDVANMSLDAFQAKHTSEDNASFLEIKEKDAEKHRSKYSWVYNTDQSTLLLENGTMMSAEQRLLMDKASGPKKKRGDDRKGELKQWKYRIRNQVYFYPDMATSRDTCRLAPRLEAGEATKMLTNGDGQKPFSFNSMIAPKAINKKSTRLRETFLQAQDQAKAVQQEKSTAAAPRPGTAEAKEGGSGSLNSFVPMTPSIEPGSSTGKEDLEDLFTWGDIDSTPLMLDPSATPLLGIGLDAHDPSHGMFQVPDRPAHEKAAHALEADQRRRRASRMATPGGSLHRDHAHVPKSTPTPSPFRSDSAHRGTPHRTSGAGGGASRRNSSKKRARTAADLTPAAQSFAQRLYSRSGSSSSTARGGGMFGDSSRLRSSYSSLHSTKRQKLNAQTPRSMNRSVPKSASCSAQRGSTPAREKTPGSSLTDGLLNI